MQILLIWFWAASCSAFSFFHGRHSSSSASNSSSSSICSSIVGFDGTVVHWHTVSQVTLVDGRRRAVQTVLAIDLSVFDFFVLWFVVLIFPGYVAGHPIYDFWNYTEQKGHRSLFNTNSIFVKIHPYGSGVTKLKRINHSFLLTVCSLIFLWYRCKCRCFSLWTSLLCCMNNKLWKTVTAVSRKKANSNSSLWRWLISISCSWRLTILKHWEQC